MMTAVKRVCRRSCGLQWQRSLCNRRKWSERLCDKKNKHELCKLHIVVDNVLYYWDDIEIHPVRQGEKGQYKLHIESNPKVYNRRKYPRMPISNACTIRLEGTDKTYSGKW